MNLFLLLAALSAAPATPVRSGLYQLGLGLELPAVGVLAGWGRGNPGAGYTLGASVSWEATPWGLVRLYAMQGRTQAARVPLVFLEGATSQLRMMPAQWNSLEVGVGVAYLFRENPMDITPFLGVDVGTAFNGYRYFFDGSLPAVQTTSTVTSYYGQHVAESFSWTLSLRGGLRIPLNSVLSVQTEFYATYTPMGPTAVTQTRLLRQVRSKADDLLWLRGVFSVRLGL